MTPGCSIPRSLVTICFIITSFLAQSLSCLRAAAIGERPKAGAGFPRFVRSRRTISAKSRSRSLYVAAERLDNGCVPDVTDRLRALLDAGIALNSELSLDALLQRLVETAAELTGRGMPPSA